MAKAQQIADVAGYPARKAASAAKGKLRGLGYSAFIEACGIAPSAAVGSLGAGVGLWESAEVRVNPIGTVEVLTGSHSHGQGHETTFAQLVSERLVIPIDNVAIVHGDTDKVQMGMGTYGSRSGAVGMSAIVKALDKIEAKAKKVAGAVLEAEIGGRGAAAGRTGGGRQARGARPDGPARAWPSGRAGGVIGARNSANEKARSRSSAPWLRFQLGQ